MRLTIAIPDEIASPRLIVAEAVNGLRSGAAGVLPLSLGGQPVLPSPWQPPGFLLLVGKHPAKLDRFAPFHVLDRQFLRILSRCRIARALTRVEAGIAVHHLAVLALRDLVLSEPESACQLHIHPIELFVPFAHLKFA